ncbi:monovalent cation/H(+) antiporter subunit G [Salinimicrobium xinjiangense]|uniref:monovalent cation/H(+) antiporter subunit G n=1 Tax=Salinimicrobium xinjiangense TaxID=438596 RepID=UPI000419FC66|nr:monovalent cation/H(+) antiporter subunit G [Salinimicrobium xinjiangense]
MIDVIIMILASFGAIFVLLGAVGILRMPDTYLRMAVTTKAATLGVGLLLIAAALYFNDTSTTTRVLAIIIFILLTAPVGAHIMGRASYIAGNKLWEKSVCDDLEGKYKAERNFSIAPEEPGEGEDLIQEKKEEN